LTEAPEMAKKQAEEIAAQIVSQGGPVMRPIGEKKTLLTMDSQAIALIAYLQRVGIDLFKPADAPATDPAATPATSPAATPAVAANQAASVSGDSNVN
jgi:cytochrome c oxidase cbb3-type subunit I/II